MAVRHKFINLDVFQWRARGESIMRTLGLAGAFVLAGALSIAFGSAGPALAQSPLEGPLAAPDAPAAAPSKPKPAKAKAHHKKTAHADKAHGDAAIPAGASEPATETPKPTSHAKSEAADPVSIGMKWNGSNDDARETRVQNYNGDAAGTGGAVGLNFHF